MQQPIRKLRILIFHEFLKNQIDFHENIKTHSNKYWSTLNSLKYRFLILDLVGKSDEFFLGVIQ